MQYYCPSCNQALIHALNLSCNNAFCSETEFPIRDGIPFLYSNNSPFRDNSHSFDGQTKIHVKRNSSERKIYRFAKNLIAGRNLITQRNYEFIAKQINSNTKILFIGGATIGHGAHLIYNSTIKHGGEIHCIDVYPSSHTTAVADAHYLPYPEGYFDIVIIQAVLEHVVSPVQVVNEILRVLSNNSIVYSEVPFMQSIHEGAFDFARFTLSGHQLLFRKFIILSSGVHHGPSESVLFIISHYLQLLFGRYARYAIYLGLIRVSRLADRLIFSKCKAVDIACGTFVMARKVSEFETSKLTLSDIRSMYRGLQ
jgi:SAM-dependent methyltransferase